MKIGFVHAAGVTLEPVLRALSREGDVARWSARDLDDALARAATDPVEVVLWAVGNARPSRSAAALRALAALQPIIAMYEGDRELAVADEALMSGAASALDLTRIAAGDPSELRARLLTARRLNGGAAAPERHGCPPIIAIGASTGGPQALAQVCAALPRDFAGALVIVQHIEAMFTASLVDALASVTELSVREASEGSMPEAGSVFLAARADHHLVLDARQCFHYTSEPRSVIHRPSIDVLFESISRTCPARGAGVLLTGMGRDGARGLGLLRAAGFRTIAQDEQTSAVYGMPRAAVESGAASEVLPISAIGPALALRA